MRSIGSGRFQPEESRLTQNKPARRTTSVIRGLPEFCRGPNLIFLEITIDRGPALWVRLPVILLSGNRFQVLNMMIWNAAIYWTLVAPGYRYCWQR
jgi:hypothetical protein